MHTLRYLINHTQGKINIYSCSFPQYYSSVNNKMMQYLRVSIGYIPYYTHPTFLLNRRALFNNEAHIKDSRWSEQI